MNPLHRMTNLRAFDHLVFMFACLGLGIGAPSLRAQETWAQETSAQELHGVQQATLVQRQPIQHPSVQNQTIQHQTVQRQTLPTATPPMRVAESGFPELRPIEASDQANASTQSGKLGGTLVSTLSSLAIVLGLFAGIVWFSRRFSGNSGIHHQLPKSVFETLGSSTLDARTKVLVLRCGQKVVAVAQTSAGIQPITEWTDPNEVAHLLSELGVETPKSPARTSSELAPPVFA